MLDSAILEVIIGMVFIYSLLSILVTQINSLTSGFLRLRARHLREGITSMISDEIIRAKILTHPLICLVADQVVLPEQTITEEEAHAITYGKVNDVTWIDPKTFANVLMSLIRVDSDKELFGAMLNVVDGMPSGSTRRRLRLILNRIMTTGDSIDELREAIQNIPEEIYREALTEALDEIDDEIGKLGLEPSNIVSIMAGLRKIKDVYLRTALDTILATSQTIEEAEEQLMQWFNNTMDRATQTFAQKMQMISLIVGLLIAVLGNVDTINIARTLWEDPALRDTINTIAQNTDIASLETEYANAQARIAENLGTTQPDAEATPEAGAEPSGTTNDNLADITANLIIASEAASDTLIQLVELRVPMGWYYEDLTEQEETLTYSFKINDATNLWNFIPGNNPDWLTLILTKIIGWGATVIAIAQGAPFWFNLLRRLTGR